MALINEIIARIPQDEEGQGLAEYALILALIAIVAIVALHLPGRPGLHDPLDRRRLRLGSRSGYTSTAGRRLVRRPSCFRANSPLQVTGVALRSGRR